MAKLNIVILDGDKVFLDKISNYLINKTDKFTVTSFSDWDRFAEGGDHSGQDIMLFSEDYAEKAKDFETGMVKILMSENFETDAKEYASVKKYQKLDAMVKDILFIYSDKTGDSSYIVSGRKDKKIISVYSPIGGSGKTTLAVLLAKTLSISGVKVLYLNFERVSSMAGIFNNNSLNCMTDVFLAAKSHKGSIPAKILSNVIQNQASKIYYINPAESCTEYAQMTDEEVMDILDAAEGISDFDYVIVDFLGEFNTRVLDILRRSRKVLFPYLNNDLARQKLSVFIEEMKRLKQEETILDHTIFVENKAEDNISEEEIIKIPYSESYASISSVLKNHNVGFEDLEPIIRQL